MSEEKGCLYQKYEPTPDNPCEIKVKNLKGLNLLNQFEVNGIKYTDNIPNGFNIGITKEQYVKYQQQETNWKELKKWVEEHIENANKYLNNPNNNWDEDTRGYALARKFMLEETLNIMKKLENKNVNNK